MLYAKAFSQGVPSLDTRRIVPPVADRTSVMTLASDNEHLTTKPIMADTVLLRCPKCSDRMIHRLLDIDEEGRQNVWWTCAGIEKYTVNGKKKCSFPLYIQGDVFWVKRSPLDIQRGFIPRPNIRNLPSQFRCLYPTVFNDTPISSGRSSVIGSRVRSAHSDGMSVASSDDRRSIVSPPKSVIRARKRLATIPSGGPTSKKDMIVHQPTVSQIPSTSSASTVPEPSAASVAAATTLSSSLTSLNSEQPLNQIAVPKEQIQISSRTPSPIGFHDETDDMVYKPSTAPIGSNMAPDKAEGDPRSIRAMCGIAGPGLSPVAANVMDKFHVNDRLLDVYPIKPDIPRLKATMTFNTDQLMNHPCSSTNAEQREEVLKVKNRVHDTLKKYYDEKECAEVVDLTDVVHNAYKLKEEVAKDKNVYDPVDRTKMLLEMKNRPLSSKYTSNTSLLNQRSFTHNSISEVEAWNRRNKLLSLLDKKKNQLSTIRHKRLELYARHGEGATLPIPMTVPTIVDHSLVEMKETRGHIDFQEEQHIEKEVSAMLAAKIRKYKQERLRKSQAPCVSTAPYVAQNYENVNQEIHTPQLNMHVNATEQAVYNDAFGIEEWGNFVGTSDSNPDWSVHPNRQSCSISPTSEDEAAAMMRQVDEDYMQALENDVYDFDYY